MRTIYTYFNANPEKNRVEDCTVRAIAKALGKSWEAVSMDINIRATSMHDMAHSNAVWGSYLREMGFTRTPVPSECPDCYTVRDFAADNPKGTFVLALDGHVVCMIDGNWYDTWDSGDKTPLYYWERKDD